MFSLLQVVGEQFCVSIYFFTHYDFSFLVLQLVDEIDLRKCYVDIDKKFKGQHGIILSLSQWRKLVKAVNYVDKKIAIVKAEMENAKKRRKGQS